MSKRIARVFPRRTKATPEDDLAFVGQPGLFPPEVDAVHVSVTFTWDLAEGERLVRAWSRIAPTSIGGPATGEAAGEFVPGRYLKPGYTITSRGCPNRCWFCYVWKRQPELIELPICEGWNLLDDNLLACSDKHVWAVLSMLGKQKHRPELTGGLEAKLLKQWHVDAVLRMEHKPKSLWFAYDTPDDFEPLVAAAKMFEASGWYSRDRFRCYVLVGYPGDTQRKASERLDAVVGIGMDPMAMLWRPEGGTAGVEWRA